MSWIISNSVRTPCRVILWKMVWVAAASWTLSVLMFQERVITLVMLIAVNFVLARPAHVSGFVF